MSSPGALGGSNGGGASSSSSSSRPGPVTPAEGGGGGPGAPSPPATGGAAVSPFFASGGSSSSTAPPPPPPPPTGPGGPPGAGGAPASASGDEQGTNATLGRWLPNLEQATMPDRLPERAIRQNHYSIRLRICCEVLLFLGCVHLGIFPDWWNGVTNIGIAILLSTSLFRRASISTLVSVVLLAFLNGEEHHGHIDSVGTIGCVHLGIFPDWWNGVTNIGIAILLSTSLFRRASISTLVSVVLLAFLNALVQMIALLSLLKLEFFDPDEAPKQQVLFLAYILLIFCDTVTMLVTGNASAMLLRDVLQIILRQEQTNDLENPLLATPAGVASRGPQSPIDPSTQRGGEGLQPFAGRAFKLDEAPPSTQQQQQQTRL